MKKVSGVFFHWHLFMVIYKCSYSVVHCFILDMTSFMNQRGHDTVPIMNNKISAITRVTRSLGLLIGEIMSFEDHVERVCTKAKCSWENASRVLGCKKS